MQTATSPSDPGYRRPIIADFEDAIDVLLTAYLEQKRNPVGAKRLRTRNAFPASEFGPGSIHETLDWLENPLGQTLRAGIREMSERLHSFLRDELAISDPTREMRNCIENIASRDPGQEGRRGAILDKIWDGIGDWTA
jgi:hypothetical protein